MHKDAAGNYLNIGDEVWYAKGNGLYHGFIQATTPKMVRVGRPNSNFNNLIYPDDCIIPGRLPQ